MNNPNANLTFGDKLGLIGNAIGSMGADGNKSFNATQATQQVQQMRQGQQQQNMTRTWIAQNAPDLAPMLQAGAAPRDVLNAVFQRQQKQRQDEADQKRRQGNSMFLPEGDLRNMVSSGAMDFQDAYKMHKGGIKPTSSMQEYEYARGQGFEGSFMDFQTQSKKAGATNINVGNQNAMPGLGKLDGDFTYRYNPDGSVMLNEQGLPQVAPIPGGPADIEQQKIDTASQNKQEMEARTSNIVLDDIRRAKDIIQNGGMLNGTGAPSLVTRNIPGTDGHRLASKLQTIKANAGFDKLQQMRDASPTGGALGQVSERELAFLQAAIGDLDQSQNQEDLLYNLERVEKIYNEIINGPSGANQTGGAQPQGQPMTTQGGVQFRILD